MLLEPIMKLEISTPDEHVGDLVSDLQQRRAIIQSTESRGTATVLHAEAPLANLFGYSSAMRSLSQGRASCSMEPSTYAPAPDDVLQKFLGRIVSRGLRMQGYRSREEFELTCPALRILVSLYPRIS